MSLTTARASSAPNSLTTSVPAASSYSTAGTATLTWSPVGSDPIATVSVAVSLSPVTLGGVASPWTGAVSLLCISFGSGQACLGYTYGSEYMAFQEDAYTGYFIEWMYTGGAAVRSQCKVSGTLTANIWNRVELRVSSGSDTVEVLFGGTSAGTCDAAFDADTNFKVAVGPKVASSTSFTHTMYYDNVTVAATRSR